MDSWFGIPGLGFLAWIPGFGFLGLNSWVWIPWFGFKGLDSWVWIPGFGFLIPGFGVLGWIPGFGFPGLESWVGVLGSDSWIWTPGLNLTDGCAETYDSGLVLQIMRSPLTKPWEICGGRRPKTHFFLIALHKPGRALQATLTW